MGRRLAAADFDIAAPTGANRVRARVIGVVENQAPTRALEADLGVDGGLVAMDTAGDVCQIALVERHRGTGAVVNALVSGFGYNVPCAVQEEGVSGQLAAILRDVATLNKHISPFRKKNLTSSFQRLSDTWTPKIAGQINDMQIKLARFEGKCAWRFHKKEDALVFVHKGRLLMKFRDRDEIVEAGEFIVVPHGVEHCPVPLDDTCEVVLLEPDTTVTTGREPDRRTAQSGERTF
jgi:mannose-6-phosphate isomerase-like protein (cupin superfamily)